MYYIVSGMVSALGIRYEIPIKSRDIHNNLACIN